jgi:polysaccharide deacetylase family protein (PEP-CTERM system associated)
VVHCAINEQVPNLTTNALTIDFEDWYQGLEIPSTSWEGFEDRIPRVGRRLLAILAECGVRATFFVLGHLAERHPQLVREIAAAGHEIGTHGFSHSFVYRLTPQQFRQELTRSVRFLEDQSGQAVLGHRAPFFSITNASLWALDILADLGLRYDSSIFPVANYRYGIANAPRWPYRIERKSSSLVEFPVSTWRILGRNVPVGGGAYFRIYPYAVTRAVFRAINSQGRPVAFYLHPWEIDPDHPRIPLPRRIALTHYFGLGATEGRLRKLLSDFNFAPMAEVLHVRPG